MEQNYLARAAKYLSEQRKRQKWQKVLTCLCAVAVFCTVYALILPAITMTAPLTCELEEHQHDESCYTLSETQQVTSQLCSQESIYADVTEGPHASFVLHTHDEACYLDGQLVCTLPIVLTHIHEDECYEFQYYELICGLEEDPAPGEDPVEEPGHVHTDACYVEVRICGLEEGGAQEGHAHDEFCYTVETIPGELICEDAGEDHEHDESCYASAEEISTLTCGLEESEAREGHTHTEECFERQLVCGLEESAPAEDGAPAGDEAPVTGHVHTEACYAHAELVAVCGDPAVEHEHVSLRYDESGAAVNAESACYDENGVLTCTIPVTREHFHTDACFETAPVEEPVEVLTCEKEVHTHGDYCYTLEEPEDPEQPDEPPVDDGWDAIFWSDVVSESSDVVLDAWTNGSWADTAAMEPERLAELRAAGEADLTRALQSAAIQVGAQAYDSEVHGPMDPNREFNIVLTWSLDSTTFSGMTYSYRFPEQIHVEDVEKRVLNDGSGVQALAYSVWDNVLTVTYYAPAESVTTGFSLRAGWAGELGMETEIQWSRSEYTYVTFAEPELTVEKTMGEDGLRVAEDGTVWADYTVTVTNSGMVAASSITLTDVLEAERFAFAQGSYEDGADYQLTAGGRDTYEYFTDYDGGDTVTFPAFDLEPEESRIYQYRAVMSAEDREAVDAAIKASADRAQAAVTVRNTATAVCPAPSGDLEFTGSAKATYGGPASKHLEDFIYTYEAGAFDVAFTVNGDAQLPLGLTMEKLENTTGEGLQMTVETLDETAEEYQAFAQHVEGDEEESENLLDLQVLRIGMNYNGTKLDLSDCDVKAVVTPSEALKNYREPRVVNYNLTDEEKEAVAANEVLGDEGYSIVLQAFTVNDGTAETGTPEMDATAEAQSKFTDAGSILMSMESGDEAETSSDAEAEKEVEIDVQNDEIAVYAGKRNYPTYNVEFWAYVDRVKLNEKDIGKTGFQIIDTTGVGLPENGVTPTVKYLTFADEAKGIIATDSSTASQLYQAVPLMFNPDRKLTLGMFNVLEQISQIDHNYDLVEFVIIGADGVESEPIKFDDPDTAAAFPLDGLLTENCTLKLVFKPKSGEHINSVVFYDYDVTDGMIYTTAEHKNGHSVADQDTKEWYAYTNWQGINSKENYVNGSGSAHLGFGNGESTFVKGGVGEETWDGSKLNMANNATNGGSSGFNDCTFGIPDSLDSGGRINYSSGIIAPSLFNETDQNMKGKTTYTDYSLKFIRIGDTYTMSSVEGVPGGYAQDLDKLSKTRLNWNKTRKLYSNDFWPMDETASHGTPGHDFKFGLALMQDKWRFFDGNKVSSTPKADFPADVGYNHNTFFGMQFNFEFTIPEKYVGPLDYCFFGDDDLWLFLDGQLVCDIGGVHSSVGEYVDLWDYLATKDANGNVIEGTRKVGNHKLSLFYTERGASGSTCWMQFTLPGLQSVPVDVPPSDNLGSLRIEKDVEGLADQSAQFNFRVNLSSISTDEDHPTQFKILDSSGVLDSTRTVEPVPSTTNEYRFVLKAGESLVINNIPDKATYTVWEDEDQNGNTYETTVKRVENGGEPEEVQLDKGKRIAGTIKGNTSILVTYTNTFYYALPETGAAGLTGQTWYALAALPMLTAAGLVYKKSRRKGGTHF